MKTITLPQLRQTYDYDCGAQALQAIFVYYGIEIRKDRIMKSAGTTLDGTSIRGIIKTANKYGLKTNSKQMTIPEIIDLIDKKIPVLLILQAWSDKNKVDWENNWNDSHYVVAIGYTKERIIFEDPSSFHRTYLKYNELNERWHSIDTDGKKYFHHAIAVFGKKPQFNKDKIVHMD